MVVQANFCSVVLYNAWLDEESLVASLPAIPRYWYYHHLTPLVSVTLARSTAISDTLCNWWEKKFLGIASDTFASPMWLREEQPRSFIFGGETNHS
jgi:hypothetical protein